MMEPRPLSLLAEITYRCNLQCPYCYNPLDLGAYRHELDASSWCRVIDQAADLGIVQLHLSGGEPTLRAADCCTLIRHARKREIYVNLITQGTFLTGELLDQLLDAGLEHIQVSLQAADADTADPIAGARVHERKLEALRPIVTRDVALTINYVLHRGNIDDVESIIALAKSLGVRRLELANTQFYGWAFANRAALLPSPEQVERAAQAIRAARARLGAAMEISHVLADYYQEYPKPCMNGWARQFMTVAPDGRAFPCPAAAAITSLRFDNVQDRSLADIWFKSAAFNAYRGTGWMPQPCRSCERREIDWGGCRCQAFLVTGNAGATDPACSLSPQHGLIVQARTDERQSAFVPRRS